MAESALTESPRSPPALPIAQRFKRRGKEWESPGQDSGPNPNLGRVCFGRTTETNLALTQASPQARSALCQFTSTALQPRHRSPRVTNARVVINQCCFAPKRPILSRKRSKQGQDEKESHHEHRRSHRHHPQSGVLHRIAPSAQANAE